MSSDLEKGNPLPVSDLDDATIAAEDTGPEEDAVVTKTETAEQDDPNIVFWDGPDDPENPMNWPERKKWINIGVLSFLTVIT